MAKTELSLKSEGWNLKIDIVPLIPFIFLILTGLIEGQVTYHQKVFKTLLVFIFDIAMAVIFFIQYNGNFSGLKKEKKFLFFFLFYFIHVLIIYLTSFITGEVTYDRDYYISNYSFMILLSMFFFLYIRTIEDIKRGILIVGGFFFIVMIWSFYDFIKVANFNLSQFRPKFSFGNTDYFSGYAIGLLPLLLLNFFIWFKKDATRTEKIIGITSLVLGIFGIVPVYFSQTRSAIFGLFLGIMVVIIPSFILIWNRYKFYIRVVLAAGFIVFFLVTPYLMLKYPTPLVEKYLPRFVKTVRAPQFAVNDRLNGWAGGLGLLKLHPVFGAGIGTVYPASFRFIDKYHHIYSPSNSFKHSHNEYVEVLGEGGIFGLLFFLSLVFFVIVLLYMRFLSNRYDKTTRIVSLGIVAGLFSMMIHQIFSLSLRMSVTQSAFFSLLGLGIAVISLSSKKVIASKEANSEPQFAIKNKHVLIITAVSIISLIWGFILFRPLYQSENWLRRAVSGQAKSLQELNYMISRSIAAKPDNPYAWTQKYVVGIQYGIYDQQHNIIESQFDDIIETLDKLNSLIPDYQDVWSKYAQVYLIMKDFYSNKLRQTGNISYMRRGREIREKLYESAIKSINVNFLNTQIHIIKIDVERESERYANIETSLQDYFEAYIYMNFCKPKRVLKEDVSINFVDDSSSLTESENRYSFTFNNDDLKRLSDGIKSCADYNRTKQYFESTVNKYITEVINSNRRN